MTRLTLTNFRNYAALRIETAPRTVVLTGANGAGKTNLLEALSFLSPGRGLRRARLGDITRREAADGATWAVAAELRGPAGEVSIGTGLAADPSDDPIGEKGGAGKRRERRVVKIDGGAARGQGDLAKHASVIWLTPDMDRLFADRGSARRRFLDNLIYAFEPDHAGHVAAYTRTLRERARLLRGGTRDADWLTALEVTMAENAVAIAAARRQFSARLVHAMALGSAAFARPEIAVEGEVEAWLDDMPALAAEDRLRGLLASSRALDAETGGAAHGPHRSDFRVRHAAKSMPAELCSTGEQKALLIALVLGAARLRAIERDAPPVLLLDEIAAHLDRARRDALFAEIDALGAQAWLTGTDAALFDALGGQAQFLTVAAGALSPGAADG